MDPLAHVELELRLSGVMSERGSEPVKVSKEGDGLRAGVLRSRPWWVLHGTR